MTNWNHLLIWQTKMKSWKQSVGPSLDTKLEQVKANSILAQTDLKALTTCYDLKAQLQLADLKPVGFLIRAIG